MKNSSRNPNAPNPGPLLRRMDQAVLAAVGMASLAAVVLYWFVQGGATGRLIEIDRAPRQNASFQIDINQADWPEFSVLPGIGETLARKIVASRSEEGQFADLEELRRVRGIGPKTLERIRPYLRPLPSTGNVAGR